MSDKSRPSHAQPQHTRHDPELDAFLSEIYMPSFEDLMKYYRRRTGAPHEYLEDLAGKTLLAFLEKIYTGKVDRPRWRQYLFGIAKHKLEDFMRDAPVLPLREED